MSSTFVLTVSRNKSARATPTTSPNLVTSPSKHRRKVTSSDEDESNFGPPVGDGKSSAADAKDSNAYILSCPLDTLNAETFSAQRCPPGTTRPTPEEPPSTPANKLKFKRKRTSGNLSDSDSRNNNREDSPLSPPPVKKRGRKRPAPIVESLSDLSPNSEDLAVENHSEHSLRERARDKGTRKAADVKTLDSYSDIPNSGSAHMKTILANLFTMSENVILDDLLIQDYPTLPLLRNSTLISYVGSEEEEHTMILYSTAMNELDSKDGSWARFESAVKFANSGPFINPSRASLHLVARDSSRITLASTTGRSKTAVFLTTGLLVNSSLRKSAGSGYNNTNNVHQVMLTPLTGEFECAATFIGTVFEQDDYHCLLREGSFVFSTRPEGGNDNKFTVPSKSKARTSLHAARPATVASGSKHSSNFPASLGFNDEVAIYDVRDQPDFRITPSFLKTLSQLPWFRKDKVDPSDNKYIATVGYSLNSWSKTYRGLNQFCVSMNILFLILLGERTAGDGD
ncbi:hypothetical protein F5887DRAFT_1079823 [Amanita rubescens]|nr:hypothetical protein F5887DRAFT_1085351 [Amanita rubescens]KAF8333815.1 hypothetical protein F5887DRAFT_1079823 [Amanita rubescens]